MAMKIPSGNPFGVNITPQSTQQMGLVAMPETDYSPDKVAAKLDQAGDQITKSALAWQQEQNNTRVQMFSNDIKELANDLETNPNTGFANLQGRNATERPGGKDMPTEVIEQFDARVQALMQHMSPAARKAAQQVADATRANLQFKANKHLIEQSAVVKQHENLRSLNAAMIDSQSDDAETRNSGFYVGRLLTEQMAREKGVWPPDYSKTLGVMHGTRIETLVDGSRIDEAKEWLKANKHEMSADQYKAAKDLIEKGADNKKAADLSSKIIASGKSDAEMIRSVEEVDPKHRNSVRKIVQQHISTQEAIRRQEVQDLVTESWGIAVNGGDIPLSMRAELEAKAPQKLASIDRYLNSKNGGKAIKTDRGTWEYLWNMAQEKPEEFARINLTEYLGELSESDASRFASIQKGIAKEDRRAFMREVKSLIKKQKLDKNAYAIESAAVALWNEELENTKAKSVPAARRKEMVNQLFKVEDVAGFWSFDKPQWEIISSSDSKPSEAVFAAVYGVNPKDIRANLEKKGVKPTVWNEKTQRIAVHYVRNNQWPKEVRDAAMKRLELYRKQMPNEVRFKNPNQQIINALCQQLYERGEI